MLNKVYIIAEAGVNHNGNIDMALELVRIAAASGADAVKFQSFRAEKLVSKEAKKAEYQNKNLGDTLLSQFDMLKTLELSHADHVKIVKECSNNNIQFLSTAFDVDGIDYLDNYDIPFYKCPSGEITNYQYLKKLGKKHKPVILSTGMSHMHEVKEAINLMVKNGKSLNDIILLHCNTQYPTPMEDVNLLAMLTLKEELGVDIGYSDHTLGIEASIAAVALGAKVIEKHFTISRELSGPDHAASIEPHELSLMIRSIRNVEKAIGGSGLKTPSLSETENILIARKSLFAAKRLNKGDVLREEDFVALRPGDGISPMEIPNLIGRTLNVDLEKLEKFKYSMLR